MKIRTRWIALPIVGILALAGCSATGTTDDMSLSAPEPGAAQSLPDGATGESLDLGVSPGVAPGQERSTAVPSSSESDAQADRAIVRTAQISVVMSDPEQGARRAGEIAGSAEGWVSGSYRGDSDCYAEAGPSTRVLPPCPAEGGSETIRVTLRVPEAEFDTVVSSLSGLGEVVALSSQSNDVTETLVDVEARIATQQASVKRVRALLAKATTIEEIVTVERELTKRQAELESLQARQKSLSDSAAMSTVTVSFSTEAEQVDAEPSWWTEVGDAFTATWTGFAIFLIVISPLVVLALAVLGLVLLLIRRQRAARAEREGAPSPGPDQGAGPDQDSDTSTAR